MRSQTYPLKNGTSSEQLDVDGDSSSEVSSEINFNFEYAQMEVTMKALGSNVSRPLLLLRTFQSCWAG